MGPDEGPGLSSVPATRSIPENRGLTGTSCVPSHFDALTSELHTATYGVGAVEHDSGVEPNRCWSFVSA